MVCEFQSRSPVSGFISALMLSRWQSWAWKAVCAAGNEEQSQIPGLLCHFTLQKKRKNEIGKSIQIFITVFVRERKQGQAQLQAWHKIPAQSSARAEAEVSTCDVAALSNQETITSFANPTPGRERQDWAGQCLQTHQGWHAREKCGFSYRSPSRTIEYQHNP